MAALMETGIVKRWDDAKGYGFITPDEGGKDLFVHHTRIQMNGRRNLEEGGRVEFEIVRGPKGLEAHNVRPI